MKLVSEVICFIAVKIQNFNTCLTLNNGITYYSKVLVTYNKVKKEFVADGTKRIWSFENGFTQLKWLDLSLEPSLKHDHFK